MVWQGAVKQLLVSCYNRQWGSWKEVAVLSLICRNYSWRWVSHVPVLCPFLRIAAGGSEDRKLPWFLATCSGNSSASTLDLDRFVNVGCTFICDTLAVRIISETNRRQTRVVVHAFLVVGGKQAYHFREWIASLLSTTDRLGLFGAPPSTAIWPAQSQATQDDGSNAIFLAHSHRRSPRYICWGNKAGLAELYG